ncbi:tyrosine--tRNA ligase [Ignavibacteria bacterium]|nr:tyrosine--tRNA ligase [Bacteroidota bacterium]
MFLPLNEQMDIIRAGAAEIFPEDEIARKIERSVKTKKPLTIKLGCDPSRPDLHVGHAVVLRKLRQFQDLGHEAVLIVGDFTGMIGDPTGKSKTRPPLTIEETRINGKSYFEQAAKILSLDRLKMTYNSDWLGEMSFHDVVTLTGKFTVAQMLEREDFDKRYRNGEPIGIHEFLYPLAQAVDSVAVKSDVELGGTDQKFNLIVGREIQRAYNAEPQCIVLMPILEGTDGIEKMSKSLGNYIGLSDSPKDMFGKVMSIPDTLTARYFLYAANASPAEAAQMEENLKNGSLHPRTAKVEAAKKVVALYYDEAAANAAFEEFERVFVKKDLPDEIPAIDIALPETSAVADVLTAAGLASSKGEARRLIEGGGVRIDGEKVLDARQTVTLDKPKVFKVGKLKFARISIK